MTLKFELSNQNLINVTRTTDALSAFYNSVNNGQMRLALEVFAEILPVLIDHVNGNANSGEIEEITSAVQDDKPKSEDKPKPKANKSADNSVKDEVIEA